MAECSAPGESTCRDRRGVKPGQSATPQSRQIHDSLYVAVPADDSVRENIAKPLDLTCPIGSGDFARLNQNGAAEAH